METIIDHNEGTIKFPFMDWTPIVLPFSKDYIKPHLNSYMIKTWFDKYCRDVYGLTQSEIEYVWDDYIEKLVNMLKDA